MDFGLHILVGDRVVTETDPTSYAEWAKDDDKRRVALTYLPLDDSDERVRVSTAFLTIPHGSDGFPRFFETRVFGGKRDGDCERYADYWTALRGHDRMVKHVLASLDEDTSP